MIRPREALFSGLAGRTLFALAAGTAVVPLGQLVLPPLLPAIVREFSIPPSLAGVGLTVMWASAPFAMFPGGRLSDVTGCVTALVAAVAPRGSTAVYTGVFVVGLLMSPVAGGLGDRFGHRRAAVGALGLSATFLASTDAVVRIGLFVFAVGLVGFWPVMTASLMNSLSRERLGGDYAFSRAVFFGVGSLGPTYVGIAARRLSYAAAYGGLVGCFLLSAVAIRALGRFE